jgi:hypothetical protein
METIVAQVDALINTSILKAKDTPTQKRLWDLKVGLKRKLATLPDDEVEEAVLGVLVELKAGVLS